MCLNVALLCGLSSQDLRALLNTLNHSFVAFDSSEKAMDLMDERLCKL